jgi:predicted flap endonuclease-1-like 5' DNA nuclease
LTIEERGKMRTVWTLLIGLIASVSGVLLLVWLLWRLWTGDEEKVATVVEIEVPEGQPEAPVEAGEEGRDVVVPSRVEEPSSLEEADDLTVIGGIGPKISQVLRDAGVATFAQLAAIDADSIQAILTAADPRLGRLADPGTWPAQAALAAEGDLEALSDLQDELKSG